MIVAALPSGLRLPWATHSSLTFTDCNGRLSSWPSYWVIFVTAFFLPSATSLDENEQFCTNVL